VGSDCGDDGRGLVGVELLHFARTLCASSNRRRLEQRFIKGFGRLFDLPMYGLYTLDPWTGGMQRVAAVGVGDTFLDRYEREGREVDLVDAQVRTTGRAVYNLAVVVSMDEWLEHPLYTKVAYLHDIRHVIQAPVVNRDGLVGMLHCATSDPTRAFTPYEVRLTAALASVVGTAIEGINARAGLERERDQAVVALNVPGPRW
jgi:GAF domain-containing protein